jgi:hypothetical protein
MGIGSYRRRVVAAALLSATVAYAATPVSLVRPLAGAEVDWSAGTVTASAGAAADMRMPAPEAARPGAERRARAAAVEKLHAALRALPVRGIERLGEKQVEAALGRASTTRIEYQSNGGVVLWVGVSFNELTGSPPFGGFGTDSPPHRPPGASREPVASATTAPLVLAVGAMRLELAPWLVVGGKEIVTRNVRYQQGPPPADSINARRDDKGRLVLSTSAGPTLDRLAGGPVVIYLEKVLP